MLSPSLVAAVERDLTVARQLAYFHIGYSPDGQDMEIDPERFVSGALHDATDPTSSTAANAATHMRVAVSNPVQRPRQGTCAVLMELTRPLTWLSHRGRQGTSGSRGGGGGGSSANAVVRTMSSSSVGAAGEATSTSSSPSAAAAAASGAGVSASSVYTTTAASRGGTMASAASSLSAGAGAAPAASRTPHPLSVNAANATTTTTTTSNTTTTLAPALPLLVATATLEVVFPARYPHEPCQWHLSEEVSFGAVGDHSTSSWAVTANHRPGSRGVANTAGAALASGRPGVWSSSSSSPSSAAALNGEEGVPRRPMSSRLLAATSGENTLRAGGEEGVPGVAASVVTAEASSRLTAFVVPAVGRQLLRWIAERRTGSCVGCPPTPTGTTTAAALLSGRSTATPARTSHSDVSPFLLDFACLLRCWSAMELDVHHLLLPSRIAMAYGGGAQLLRVMTGTHLSGGGGGSNGATGVGGAVAAGAGGGGAAAGTGATAVSIAGSLLTPTASAMGNGSVGGGANIMSVSGRPGERFAATGVASPLSPGSAHSTNTATTGNSNSSGFLGGGIGSPTGALAGLGTSSTASAPAVTTTAVSLVAGASTASAGATGNPTATGSSGASALYPHRRRAVKHFIAVLLPQGDVLVCGSVPSATAPTRRAGAGAGGPSAGGNTATAASAAAQQLDRLPFCLVPLYEQMQRSKDGEASGTTTTKNATAAVPSSPPRRRPAAVGTLVSCTSQFVRGKVLPSFLLPAHVLGSAYKCDWDDVRLFTGKSSDAALHASAKLAKALHLPGVSDLLQVLRRLAKNVGTSTTGVVYLGEVLWPTLMETVRVLRSTRLPFWAGVALCSLLLPSVLEQDAQGPAAKDGRGRRGVLPCVEVMPLANTGDETGEGGGGESGVSGVSGSAAAAATARPLRKWRQMFAELIDVVAYTERVLALAQEYTLLCETRLVRCALQRGQQQLAETEVHPRGQQRTHPVPRTVAASPAEMCRRLHAPISVCAVCGLSLLRNTVKQQGDSKDVARTSAGAAPRRSTGGISSSSGHVDAAAENASVLHAALRTSLQARRAEGCLVVQCARCGHGGHVEHISSWWNDPTVHCCPKGCDCICEY